MVTMLHKAAGQHFILSPMRTVFWQDQQTLILSDLHLGKTTHFRKAGIAVPHHMFKNDLHRLWHCIQFFKPTTIIIVGDMFHSTDNKEHDLFAKWIKDISGIQWILVKGNHDILSNAWYTSNGITTVNNCYTLNNIGFVHDAASIPQCVFVFSGHIHPGVAIKGAGRQSLRLPCFHFSNATCTLPAFGTFTGLAIIKTLKNDTVYAVVEDTIVKL